MANVNDLFAQPQTRGNVGQGVVSTNKYAYRPDKTYDPSIDAIWARGYAGSPVAPGISTSADQTYSDTTNPYYDYFYSGQDIIVTVDGADSPRFRTLPIVNFGWSVQQQKAPVYGFWSYTYDAVLRGTRLVQGAFTLATRYPNYIKDLITEAAQTRQDSSAPSYTYFRGLTEDDQNIAQYWGTNPDPSLNSLGSSVYSVHPPFSFVIYYGIQNSTIDNFGAISQFASQDNPYYQDINERLVPPSTDSYTVVLDACEIQSMETQFGVDGSPLTETYTFFARDIIT